MPDRVRSAEVVVVVGHPREDSYNQALTHRAVQSARSTGAHVEVHDLYADGFDPVLRDHESWVAGSDDVRTPGDPVLERYRHDVTKAEVLVVVHPTWWGKPPAMVSGWLDRVLVPGVAYRLAVPGALPERLLRVRRLIVVNTTETPPAHVEVDPLADIWGVCVASYLAPGDELDHERLVLADVTAAGHEQRVAWLDEVEAIVVAAVGSLG